MLCIFTIFDKGVIWQQKRLFQVFFCFYFISYHFSQPLKGSKLMNGGVYLKISERISLTGSAGGIPPEPPFRPPRLEAEAKRTISSFSLAANSFI